MCGRYVYNETETLEKRFRVKAPKKIRSNYNTAPGQVMPIIRSNGRSNVELDEMKWGLIPFWAKDAKIGYHNINARAETIAEKPTWKHPFKSQRCLIPASGFYEWEHEDGRRKPQPYYIAVKRRKTVAFAGIWDTWRDAEGKAIHSYSIITTTPNKEMSALHDRMPVILKKEHEQAWLNEDDQDFLKSLLKPYDDNTLAIIAVSKDVNTVKNNDGYLIKPINSKYFKYIYAEP